MLFRSGEILYHPQMQLLDSGWVQENNGQAAGYSDGNHEEIFAGKKRMATVKTIGYTGWKVVGVTPENAVSLNTIKTRLFIVFVIALILCILALINSYISSRITNPIRELEKSVGVLEAGNLSASVYIGGSYEIRHLGKSISDMAGQIRLLMQDIVREHEAKRKQEFDTLQSQINPHFLYNTMDMINWQALQGHTNEVSTAVQNLSRFYKLTLSRKKGISTIECEEEHVSIYITLQNMRYHDSIDFISDIPDELMEYQIPKLTLQPVVENAILHGILEKESKSGTIVLTGWLEESDIVILISDDGVGISPEKLQTILSGTGQSSSGGTNIAIYNTHRRLQILYGQKYGLSYTSIPGQGTEVQIRIPAKKES